jgi:hypothetical protein
VSRRRRFGACVVFDVCLLESQHEAVVCVPRVDTRVWCSPDRPGTTRSPARFPCLDGLRPRGHDQSGTFRALVAELEASDLIVHIVTATGLPGGVAGTTRFAGRGGESRYVRIDLAAWLTAKQRVSILAHELQHACEIARSDAGSSGAIDALFRAIGTFATIPGGFETAQAEAAGRMVWTELDGRRLRTVTAER